MTLHIGWPHWTFLVLLALQGLFFIFWIIDYGTEGRRDGGPAFVVNTMVFVGLGIAFELWLLWCGGFFGGSS